MSKRDKFAMAALSGIIASEQGESFYYNIQRAAERAYELADAMLKARERDQDAQDEKYSQDQQG